MVTQGLDRGLLLLGTGTNVWLTWANKTGITDFCLTLTQVGNPFQTCLIGIPYLNPSDFYGCSVLNMTIVTTKIKGTEWTAASAQVGGIIRGLNHSTIPVQELRLLGSDQSNQSCVTFSSWSDGTPETKVTSGKEWYHNVTSYCLGSSPSLPYRNTIPKALPPGYFLVCGDRAWPGIPSKPFRGPCYLGKLSLFAASKKHDSGSEK